MAVSGIVYLWESQSVLCTDSGLSNRPHVHYAASLLLAVEGRFRLHHGDRVWEEGAVWLAPHTAHRLNADGVPLVVVHVDPDGGSVQDCAPAHPVTPLDRGLFAAHTPALRALAAGGLACAEAATLVAALLAGARGEGTGSPIDGRVRRVLRLIRAAFPHAQSPAVLAEAVGLSPDRLMHVFKQQLGLTMRRYLLWLRLRHAAFRLHEGVSLTTAAHDAGFADSAHLSRTFREAFGLAPSEVFGRSSSVQVRACSGC